MFSPVLKQSFVFMKTVWRKPFIYIDIIECLSLHLLEDVIWFS